MSNPLSILLLIVDSNCSPLKENVIKKGSFAMNLMLLEENQILPEFLGSSSILLAMITVLLTDDVYKEPN